MGIAIVLDPMYKTKLLVLKEFIRNIHIWFMLKGFANCATTYLKIYKSGEVHQDHQVGISSSMKETSIDEDFLGHFDEEAKLRSENNTFVKFELDHYLKDKVIQRTDDFNILAWWKTNGPKYPTLMMMARDILAISVFTMASESIFSASGRLVSPHCNRLHPKSLEVLMCAQSWL